MSASDVPAPTIASPRPLLSSDNLLLFAIAALTVFVHVWTGNQYGFHRDELATLADARRLDWGYIAYPPVTPLFGRLSLLLFGTSLVGFRFFAAIAQAAALVLAGLIARELGGRRGAQLVTAAACIPFCIGGGVMMQYVAFDYFAWVLGAYFVTRLLKSDDPRWWLGIGAAIGLGMQTKYTMGFFTLGIVAGALFTDARRFLKSRWLWYGVALSILIFLPNLLWQARHHFISLDFLSHIHARDVRIGRTKDFLPDQLKITLLAFPLWLAGLGYLLFARAAKPFRMLGWMYLVPLLLFIVAKGRGYYLAAGYPMLYAAGSVWGETLLVRFGKFARALVRSLVWLALVADAVLVSAITLPIAPVNSPLSTWAFKINGDFHEELGWVELTETVARIRDSLSPEDRARLGVMAGNYGEAGALELYGPSYGLPLVISGTNSFHRRGYGDPPPEVLIVVGESREFVDENFSSCSLVAHTGNQFGVENEETKYHPNIFLCRGLRKPWPEFWQSYLRFG